MILKSLSSVQNPTVKRLLLLQSKAKARRIEGGFVVEGLRELEICVSGGYEVKEVYFVPKFVALEDLKKILSKQQNT